MFCFLLLQKSEISLFETNIRFMGSLLACYALTGDVMFRDKAAQLGERMLPAFQTETGIPHSLINLSNGVRTDESWFFAFYFRWNNVLCTERDKSPHVKNIYVKYMSKCMKYIFSRSSKIYLTYIWHILDISHIAQNIAGRCQEYFRYFIAIKILSQHFCQILQNISS